MTEAERIRVLIADDHTLVREALCLLISGEPDMQVVGEAGDGFETVQKAEMLQPDVILLDLVMPDPDGYAVLRHIRARNELAEIPVVVLEPVAAFRREHPGVAGQHRRRRRVGRT